MPKEKQKRLESKSMAKELIGEKDKSLLFFRVPYLDPVATRRERAAISKKQSLTLLLLRRR